MRDRLRTIGYRVMEIARLSRSKGQEQKEKMEEKYRELVRLTRQVRAVLGRDPERRVHEPSARHFA